MVTERLTAVVELLDRRKAVVVYEKDLELRDWLYRLLLLPFVLTAELLPLPFTRG